MTKPIVGIGELLWDIYPDGRKVAGGAPFNFAFHCHQLGHEAVIVSRVGEDDLGRELRERVRELGLSNEFIQTDRRHPTGTVRVELDENGVPSYAIAESVAWDWIEWDEKLELLAKTCPAVCFGSLCQRADGSRPSIQRFLTVAASAVRVFDVNLRLAFDIERVIELSLRQADWIKLNEDELQFLKDFLNLAVGSPDELVELLYRHLLSEHKLVLLTRGELGSSAMGGSNRAVTIHEPGVPAKVIDTVGAGDAFTAAMLCLHLEGRPLRECARFANHYAARVCEHVGATPRINRAEVERDAGLSPC
jgi:fructokinase